MQFFPASMSGGAQSFRASSPFELMDTRSGQDFHDLFSAHLDQPDAACTQPQAAQPQPSANQEQAFADDHALAEDGRGKDYCESSPREEENVSVSPDAAGHEDGSVEESAGGAAKAAAQEPGASDASGHANSGSAAGRAATTKESAARDVDNAEESAAVAVQELLDGLADEVKARGADRDGSAISEKIAALQELLRQFQKSDPAARSELAVTLGEQMRSLKAELAATGTPAGGDKNLEHTKGSARNASSGVVRKIDALLVRLEAYRKAGHENVEAEKASADAGSSLAAKAEAKAGEEAGRSRAAGSSLLMKEAAQKAADEKTLPGKPGAALEPEIPVAPESGQGSKTGVRSASREGEASNVPQGQSGTRVAASENSGGKRSLTLEVQEDAPLPQDRQNEPVLNDADRKHAAAKDQEGAARNIRTVTRSGLTAAADKAAMTKDASGQPVSQDAASLARESESASAASTAAADSKGEKKQPDARQGFFGTPDGEKSSSSASRAAQGAGNTKNAAESQTLTQTAAQNSQSQFQQRMETPVSARNAEVYQQVENGAFRNLGQGVKQLVIRLDPADLGQVSVILQVRGKEVQAVLRSSNQETSVALNEQLGQLRTQLEAQGLKVGKLEVQTQLADSQSQSQWQGTENHNRYQENQELAMSAKRWRTLERVAPGLVQDVHNSGHREKVSQSGLDIFA